MLPVGAKLHHGAYLIKGVLGQGGFGITYLAVDVNLQKEVAVKEFFPAQFCGRDQITKSINIGTTGNAEFIEKLKEKFLKEARNIARLNHPNIIKIFAAFEENDTAYYVMELIEGQSLAEKVSLNGELQPSEATNYITKIGEALEYLHAHHMTHLDVKPGNIMIRREDNSPILIDFGLSKNYDNEGQQTTTTTLGVSPGYSPLEQYNMTGNATFTPKSDLYSLAATYYFTLVGKTPPEATSILNNPLVFPEWIPPFIADAIRKAMSASTNQRHETVGEFLRQIKDYSTTQSVKEETPRTNQSKQPKTVVYETPMEHKEKPKDHKGKDKTPVGKLKTFAILALLVLIGGTIYYFVNNNGTTYKPSKQKQSTIIDKGYKTSKDRKITEKGNKESETGTALGEDPKSEVNVSKATNSHEAEPKKEETAKPVQTTNVATTKTEPKKENRETAAGKEKNGTTAVEVGKSANNSSALATPTVDKAKEGSKEIVKENNKEAKDNNTKKAFESFKDNLKNRNSNK